MNCSNCVCILLIVSVSIFSVLSKPIVEKEEEQIFDSNKSSLTNDNTTTPTVQDDQVSLKNESEISRPNITETTSVENTNLDNNKDEEINSDTTEEKDEEITSDKSIAEPESVKSESSKDDKDKSEVVQESNSDNEKLQESGSEENEEELVDGTNQERNSTLVNDQDTIEVGQETNRTIVEQDFRSKGSKVIPEKDEENEKLCTELCSSCDGSEEVFDIAEPSCFCKVTTVKSVKCLEHKVTDDILMKVIAYVETVTKSEEERLVAQYLKERENFAINRNRRCCGQVGASNPRNYVQDNLETTNYKLPKQLSIRQYNEPRQVGSKQYDPRHTEAKQYDDNNYDDDEDGDFDSDDDMLEARKIDAGPQLENLWRKALRAEETSSERPEPEEDEEIVPERPKQVKRNKIVESRKPYKYEPPASVKSLLGEKLQRSSSKKSVGVLKDEEVPNKQLYLGSSKSQTLKSNKASKPTSLEEGALETIEEPRGKFRTLLGQKLESLKQSADELEDTDVPKKQLFLGSPKYQSLKPTRMSKPTSLEEESSETFEEPTAKLKTILGQKLKSVKQTADELKDVEMPKKQLLLESPKAQSSKTNRLSKSTRYEEEEEEPSENVQESPTKFKKLLGQKLRNIKQNVDELKEAKIPEKKMFLESPKPQSLKSNKLSKTTSFEEEEPSKIIEEPPTKLKTLLGQKLRNLKQNVDELKETEVSKKQVFLGSPKSQPLKSNKLSKSTSYEDEEKTSEDVQKSPTKFKKLLGQKLRNIKQNVDDLKEAKIPEKQMFLESPKPQSLKSNKLSKTASFEEEPSEVIEEPPTKFKTVLGQKLKSLKQSVEEIKEAEAPKKQLFLGSTKPKTLNSFKLTNSEERSSNVQDNEGDKWSRKLSKSKRKEEEKESVVTKDEPQKPNVILPRQSLDDFLSDLKRQNEKQYRTAEPTENMKVESAKYKSLDDLLYERDLKRQNFLSSIRDKTFSKSSEQSSNVKRVNFKSNDKKGAEGEQTSVIKKIKNNSYKSIGTKSNAVDTAKPVKKISKIESEENIEEKLKNGLSDRLKAAREELSEKSLKALRTLDDKRIPKKMRDEILGEKINPDIARKPIVSPFIDENFQLKKKLSKNDFRNSVDEIPQVKPIIKEYSEKDNELGGGRKSKESLSALISKIKSLYAKDEQERSAKTEENSDKKILGLTKKDKSVESERGGITKNGIFGSRPTRTRQYSGEIEDEEIPQGNKKGASSFIGEQNPSTYVYPEENEHVAYENDKSLKKAKSVLNQAIGQKKSISKYENNELESDEDLEQSQTIDKYLKAKYAGVKPSLIRDRVGSSNKVLGFRNNHKKTENFKTEKEEETASPEEKEEKVIPKYTRKGNYLQNKQENADLESTKANSKELLGMGSGEKEEEEIAASEEKEERVIPKYTRKGKNFQNKQKSAVLESTKANSKALVGKQNDQDGSTSLDFDSPEEYEDEKATAQLSSEDKKKLLEKSLKEILDRNQNIKQRLLKKQKPTESLESENPNTQEEDQEGHLSPELISPKETQGISKLGSSQIVKPIEPEVLQESRSLTTEKPNVKKPSLKELIEQRKLDKVGSVQMKSVEPQVNDFAEVKSLEEEKSLSPIKKVSLKDRLDQIKAEFRPSSKLGSTPKHNIRGTGNQESPPNMSSQFTEYNDPKNKAIIDQNPQKHCEHCMEYINHMTQLQKEQMLGQKLQNPRSIPLTENQNPNSDGKIRDSPEEKFLNCRCFENQQGGEMVGQSAPADFQAKSDQFVGMPKDAMLGKPFNMQDVSNAFTKIKTGIESSVKGTNEKISKGFKELKTNLQHEYDEVSHKSLGENIKDTSDKVSKKISDLHVKDTVVNGINGMAHAVEDNYNSIASKGLDGNIKEVSNAVSGMSDKVKTEFQHLASGIVSQPAPTMYTSTAKIPYLQAKHVDTNNGGKLYPNNGNQFKGSNSGNGHAPASQTTN